MAIVYLDIHGVCADFNQAFCRENGISYRPSEIPIRQTRYPLEYLGLNNLHETISEYPVYFWEQIPLYPWTNFLVRKLCSRNAVMFLSAPSNYKYSVEGITAWGAKYFPGITVICDNDKSKYKGILIDDVEENNPAILFPARWNRIGRSPCILDILEIIKDVDARQIKGY